MAEAIGYDSLRIGMLITCRYRSPECYDFAGVIERCNRPYIMLKRVNPDASTKTVIYRIDTNMVNIREIETADLTEKERKVLRPYTPKSDPLEYLLPFPARWIVIGNVRAQNGELVVTFYQYASMTGDGSSARSLSLDAFVAKHGNDKKALIDVLKRTAEYACMNEHAYEEALEQISFQLYSFKEELSQKYAENEVEGVLFIGANTRHSDDHDHSVSYSWRVETKTCVYFLDYYPHRQFAFQKDNCRRVIVKILPFRTVGGMPCAEFVRFVT